MRQQIVDHDTIVFSINLLESHCTSIMKSTPSLPLNAVVWWLCRPFPTELCIRGAIAAMLEFCCCARNLEVVITVAGALFKQLMANCCLCTLPLQGSMSRVSHLSYPDTGV